MTSPRARRGGFSPPGFGIGDIGRGKPAPTFVSLVSESGRGKPAPTMLHREHLVQFRRSRLGAVLAKLESLGVPDSKASIVAVTPKEQFAVIIRHAAVSFDQPVADEVLPRLIVFRHARQITPHP